MDAAVWKTRLHLLMGDLASASSEQERAASVGEVRPYSRDSERLILARLLIARNEPGEALRLLAQLHATAQTAARTIEILALQAMALHAKGKKEEPREPWLKPSPWPNRRATSGPSSTRVHRWPSSSPGYSKPSVQDTWTLQAVSRRTTSGSSWRRLERDAPRPQRRRQRDCPNP